MKPRTVPPFICCCLALTLVASGCSSDDSFYHAPMITGSGSIVLESRSGLDTFHSVSASIADAEIVITQSGSQDVDVETDDNIIGEIQTFVAGGVLYIRSNVNYDTPFGVRIAIAMTDVQSLTMAGVGTMDVSGISAPGTVEVKLPGVGEITVAGGADILDATLEGVGNIDAEGLTARVSNIEIIGVGNCRTTVTGEFNVTIAGNGNVYYAGNPLVVNPPNITGIGDIYPIP